MSSNKQQTALEWYDNEIGKLFNQFIIDKINIYEFRTKKIELLEQAKEMEQSQTAQLSASWAKSREQTKETALHIGFAAGFDSGLKCSEDYYEELENTDLDEDEFSRDYILKEFEDFYTSNKF
jgi:hypothetical protein